MPKQRIKIALTLILAGLTVAAWSPAIPASAASAKHGAATIAHSTTLPANARLRREVFGFVNAGNLGNATVGYTSWDMTLLSTVAFFGLHINSGNGYIVPNDGAWNVYHSTTMSSFVATAHANGVRVIVSLNLHDFSADPNNQVCVGLLKANYTNTITETLQQVQSAGIDGVNIDYEGANTNCAAGTSSDPTTSRDRLTAFVAAFRAAMPNGYLAIDTYSGSAEDNLEFFNVSGLAPSVDAMFVMAYDMDYANATEAPINCSQYCMNPVSPLTTYRFNVTKSMSQYTALVPASKVILGQPYYGRRACVSSASVALQYPLGAVDTPTYLFASTVASQSGVYSFAAHRDGGDGVAEWDTWYDTDFNCTREQYFDDVVSLGAKYDVINTDNLAGVGLFTLDYGGGAPELWHLLDNKFATPTPWASLGGVMNSTAAVTSWGTSRTDVFVRGTDNALWHRSFDGTTWSAWESLGGVLVSAPGAASCGAGHLDVFVQGTDHGLWQKSYNGTPWNVWTSLRGWWTGSPGAVCTPGTTTETLTERGLDQALWTTASPGT